MKVLDLAAHLTLTLRQKSTGGTPVRSKPPRLSERQELQREHEEYLRDPRRERWLKDD